MAKHVHLFFLPSLFVENAALSAESSVSAGQSTNMSRSSPQVAPLVPPGEWVDALGCSISPTTARRLIGVGVLCRDASLKLQIVPGVSIEIARCALG